MAPSEELDAEEEHGHCPDQQRRGAALEAEEVEAADAEEALPLEQAVAAASAERGPAVSLSRPTAKLRVRCAVRGNNTHQQQHAAATTATPATTDIATSTSTTSTLATTSPAAAIWASNIGTTQGPWLP